MGSLPEESTQGSRSLGFQAFGGVMKVLLFFFATWSLSSSLLWDGVIFMNDWALLGRV